MARPELLELARPELLELVRPELDVARFVWPERETSATVEFCSGSVAYQTVNVTSHTCVHGPRPGALRRKAFVGMFLLILYWIIIQEGLVTGLIVPHVVVWAGVVSVILSLVGPGFFFSLRPFQR